MLAGQPDRASARLLCREGHDAIGDHRETRTADGRVAGLLAAISVDAGGNVSISSPGRSETQASNAEVGSGLISLDSGLVNASGMVKCETMIAESIVAKSYTPVPATYGSVPWSQVGLKAVLRTVRLVKLIAFIQGG